MVRNDIKNSSLLKTKFLIYAFNGRTQKKASPPALLQGERRVMYSAYYPLANGLSG